MPILLGIPHAFPTMYRNRWPPSKSTHWRFSIRDAFVGNDIAGDRTLQSAGTNPERCGTGTSRRSE